MVALIPKSLEKIWDDWNVRGGILLSLFIQVFLVLFAPLRKRSDSLLLVSSIWSAYLLADWAANFSMGLVTSNKLGNDSVAPNDFLMAFWGPFLLLHFGGTDPITAFALEDNTLWLRQIPGLLFQLGAAGYVFLITLPRNTLWPPTLLIFVAGIIKYTERTRALHLASNVLELVKKKTLVDPDLRRQSNIPSPDLLSVLPDDDVQLQVLKYVFRYLNGMEVFYGTVSLEDMNKLFYLLDNDFRSFASRTPDGALQVAEVLLEMGYELFYTKAPVLHSKVGCLLRFVALSSVVVALGLFTSTNKNGTEKLDVMITYTLLYGALTLEIISLLRLTFSEWTVMICSNESKTDSYMAGLLKFYRVLAVKHVLSHKSPRWSICKKKPYTQFHEFSTPLLFRRWSGSISGHNLISYCIGNCPPMNHKHSGFKIGGFLEGALHKFAGYLGVEELLEQSMYTAKNALLLELWVFILDELKTMPLDDPAKNVLEARIMSALRGAGVNEESSKWIWHAIFPNDKLFGKGLVLLHVATDLCYADEDDAYGGDNGRHFSKLLSDYMLYLLIMQPNLISEEIASIGKSTFVIACDRGMKFFGRQDLTGDRERDVTHKESIQKRACRSLLNGVSSDAEQMFDACLLARRIRGELQDKKWEVMSIMWVAILAYVARVSGKLVHLLSHVQQLSKGGELISLLEIVLSFFELEHYTRKYSVEVNRSGG